VKGGWAYARDEIMFSYALNKKLDRNGWVIGFGFEWAPVIAPNWTLFAEYDYYDFGTKNTGQFSAGNASSADVTQKINTVRVGANYKFNLGLH
jgi:outer membrane immunogenic protein